VPGGVLIVAPTSLVIAANSPNAGSLPSGRSDRVRLHELSTRRRTSVCGCACLALSVLNIRGGNSALCVAATSCQVHRALQRSGRVVATPLKSQPPGESVTSISVETTSIPQAWLIPRSIASIDSGGTAYPERNQQTSWRGVLKLASRTAGTDTVDVAKLHPFFQQPLADLARRR